MNYTTRLALPALLLTATPCAAQLGLSWSGGFLGADLEYTLEGDGQELYFLIPSLNQGPTPLALVDPADPRVLDVGLELLSFARSGVLAGPGFTAVETYHLPVAPALHGLPFYAQAISLPGAQTLADDVSPAVGVTLDLLDGTHPTLGDQIFARHGHSATATLDGRVLIAGGGNPGGLILPTFEWFDEQTQSFVQGGLMPEPRSRHSDTRLADGRILLAGGIGPGGALSSCVLIDPDTGKAAATGKMKSARVHHSAVLLPDGRVMVIGGSSASTAGAPLGAPASLANPASAQIEIFDPANGLWSSGLALPFPITGMGAALLPDGRILIAGGLEFTSTGAKTTKACYLFNPVTGAIEQAPPLPAPRAFFGMTPTLNDKVLLVGGAEIDPGQGKVNGSADCFVFDPNADASWSSGPPVLGIVVDGEIECVPRRRYPGGTIAFPPPLYFGGGGYSSVDIAGGTGTPFLETMTLNEDLTDWETGDKLLQPLLDPAIAPLGDGLRILVTGATAGLQVDKSAELHLIAD